MGSRKWRAAHPEYSGQRAKKGYWLKYRWVRIKQRYGLSHEDYIELWKKQRGRCAICRGKNNGKHLHVDHDHKTRRVRGLLCAGCNSVLGYFDKKRWLRRARTYLSRSQVRRPRAASDVPL